MSLLSITAEELAEKFHENYERLAPLYGYRTRKQSAVSWLDVPAENKKLMLATARSILTWLRDKGIEI